MRRSIRTFLLLLYILLSINVIAQEKMLGQKTIGKGVPSGSDGELDEGNETQNDSLLNVGNPKNVKT